MKGYKPKYLRQKNYINIINQFRAGDPLSASDIRQNVDLSLTTINNIIIQLLDFNLLRSTGKGESTKEGGKRPTLYELNPDCAACFAVLINDYLCVLYALDFSLSLLREVKFSIRELKTYGDVMSRVAGVIKDTMAEMHLEPDRMYGIACHFQGVVDGENGILIKSMTSSIPNDSPVRDDLARALGFDVPIYIENSAHFAGNYELLNPDNSALSPILVINISISPSDSPEDNAAEGVGGCLIENGQVQLNSGGFLSEMGHMIVDFDSNVLCRCGCCGCLESFIQPEYITREIRRLLPEHPDSAARGMQYVTFRNVLAMARDGDRLAQEVAGKLVRAFSTLIHNMVLGYRPRRIVIQSVDESGLIQYFGEMIRETVSRQAFFSLIDDFDITYSLESFEIQSNLGAASFCRDRYISSLITDMALGPDAAEKK